jgi:hypothetical protein
MSLTKLLVIPGGFVFAVGGLAGWLLNEFDASGKVGGFVFILLVCVAGSVIADRFPPSHPPN